MGVFDSITFGWIDEAEVKLACDNVNDQLDLSNYISETKYLVESLHEIATLIPTAWDTTGGKRAYSKVLSEVAGLDCSKFSQAGQTLSGTELRYDKISAHRSTWI